MAPTARVTDGVVKVTFGVEPKYIRVAGGVDVVVRATGVCAEAILKL